MNTLSFNTITKYIEYIKLNVITISTFFFSSVCNQIALGKESIRNWEMRPDLPHMPNHPAPSMASSGQLSSRCHSSLEQGGKPDF